MPVDLRQKISKEAQDKEFAYYRGKGGSREVVLNDPRTVQQNLISQVRAAKEEDLILAVSKALTNRPDSANILTKISSLTTQLKKEQIERETKKAAKKELVKAYEQQEPYKMLRSYYSFTAGGQTHQNAMVEYEKKNAQELKEIFTKLETFNPALTPLPVTYSGLIEPLQQWIRSQLVIKTVPAKKK